MQKRCSNQWGPRSKPPLGTLALGSWQTRGTARNKGQNYHKQGVPWRRRTQFTQQNNSGESDSIPSKGAEKSFRKVLCPVLPHGEAQSQTKGHSHYHCSLTCLELVSLGWSHGSGWSSWLHPSATFCSEHHKKTFSSRNSPCVVRMRVSNRARKGWLVGFFSPKVQFSVKYSLFMHLLKRKTSLLSVKHCFLSEKKRNSSK